MRSGKCWAWTCAHTPPHSPNPLALETAFPWVPALSLNDFTEHVNKNRFPVGAPADRRTEGEVIWGEWEPAKEKKASEETPDCDFC